MIIIVLRYSLSGPHDVDRLKKTLLNTKCSHNSYDSLYTDAVDALSVTLYDSNNWLVPPVFVIPKILNYLAAFKAIGT